MTASEKTALYVYGFTRAGATGELGVPGVDGSAGVTALDMGEIAAVVSPLAMEEVQGAEGHDRTLDLEWVAPRALRHEEVVEEVMRTSPVLPLTFGVIFSSQQALFEAVGAHRRRIAEFLEYTADKHEWAVKVYVDAQHLRDWVARSQTFREARLRLPDSPGARYFQEKRLQRELDRLAVLERGRVVDEVRRALGPAAIAMKSLRLTPREISGRGGEMVLNAAFLARADQQEAFMEGVRRLADACRPRGFTVDGTGPWPPYTFCPSLEVRP